MVEQLFGAQRQVVKFETVLSGRPDLDQGVPHRVERPAERLILLRLPPEQGAQGIIRRRHQDDEPIPPHRRGRRSGR